MKLAKACFEGGHLFGYLSRQFVAEVRKLQNYARDSLGRKGYESANEYLLSAQELWFSVYSKANTQRALVMRESESG